MQRETRACPICVNQIPSSAIQPEDYGNIYHIACPYCGDFQLYGWRMVSSFGMKNGKHKAHPELCIAVRQEYELSGREVIISNETQDKIMSGIQIPDNPEEHAHKVLKYMYPRTTSLLEAVIIPPQDYPLVYAKRLQDLERILNLASSAGYILDVNKLPNGAFEAKITETGYMQIMALQIPKITLNRLELMKLAIEEMRKSIPDPGRDSQNPKVGVVIATPDGDIIEKAHRGELRIGDHAEFTALERKSRNKDLSGCYVYTTLEPCAPGARHEPKLCCSERIFNARIAKVIIGHADPHPKVESKGIKYLEANGIEVDYFDTELMEVIREENSVYFAYALEEQKAHKTRELLPKPTVLEKAITNKRFSDFSLELLTKYRDKVGLKYEVNTVKFNQHLEDIGVLEYKKSSDEYLPTGVGYLIFGKDPGSRFPQSRVKFTVLQEANDPIIKDFEGSLLQIPIQIEEFLDLNLPQMISRERFERSDVYSSLKGALREVIINAIVHRDYTIQGAKIQIKLDRPKNTITIESPGSPMVNIERFQQFDVPTVSRNPRMAYIFFKMGLIEERGFGLRELKRLHYQGYSVNFTAHSNLLITSISLEKQTGLLETKLAKLKEEERAVYQIVNEHEQLSSSQIAELTNLPIRSVRRYIETLESENLVTRVGKGPATAYKVK